METEHFIRKTCKRYNIPKHAHELTFSCYGNQKFLLSDRICQWLIESVERAREKHNFSLWAFVFMPDHVHLLIKPMDEEYSISNILKDIKTDTARKAVKYLKENKPSELSKLNTAQRYRKYRFWQKGGGYDRDIIKESTLIDSVEYIHNNPLRKSLVDEPGKWYYSSYNCWMNGVDEPLRIDKETWPLF
ncbi:MAG: REP-associated tyrosine transposase [Planctomycetota bacterium]|jgi:putative transposase